MQLIADVSGWFASGTPAAGGFGGRWRRLRVLDTRGGQGAVGPVVAGHRRCSLQVRGVAGVPASGVAAVVLNVTVTQPTAAGFVTVYPGGVARPTASSLNFVAGETVPNLVVAPVGADGRVDFFNGSGGTVQVIADVSGWFSGPTLTGVTSLVGGTGNDYCALLSTGGVDCGASTQRASSATEPRTTATCRPPSGASAEPER